MLHFNLKKVVLMTLLGIMTTVAFSATNRYRLMFRDDPATSMVVGWHQVSGPSATVYYDVVDHGTNVANYAFQKTADRVATYRAMNNTFARLTNLTPKTKYYFVVVDQDGSSQRFWFETLPDNKFERLSIVAGGDSRNNLLPRQRANRLVAKLRPHLVMFGGDMINTDNDAEWLQWMVDWQLTIAADGRMTPVLATRGNHESSDRTIIDLFDIPTNNGAAYYAISVADDLLRIYTLNTEINRPGDQYTWLKNDAQTAGRQAVWRYGQYHRPIIPHQSSKSILTDAISTWSQTFFDEKFQLVIDSDAHMVKQTYPIRPSNEPGSEKGHIRDDENGTIYMGEGCWGAPLRSADRINNWTQASGSFNSFNLIYVDYFKTEVRTIRVDNEADVASLTDATRFNLPNNIDIFSPASGNVVVIKNKNASRPNVTINNLVNGFIFENAQTYQLQVTAKDELLEMTKISLYVNGILAEERAIVGAETEFTFDIELELNKGYRIEVVAENNINLTSLDARFVSVGTGKLNSQINATANQATELLDAAFNSYLTSTNFNYIQVGKIGNDYPTTALRFADLSIPVSAKIKGLKLEFTAAEANTRIVDWIIRAEKAVDAAEFEDGNTVGQGNVSSRALTTASVTWRPTAWAVGETYQTADLTELLNELRSDPNFTPESPLVFVITATGNGNRVAESFVSDASKAPKLVLEYDFNPTLPAILNLCEGDNAELSIGDYTYTSLLWEHDATLSSPTITVSESGIYKVNVVNQEGFSGWATTTVTVNPLPVVNLGKDTTIVDITSHVLDAGAQSSYLWSTGETTRTITVNKDGKYSVAVTNHAGCESSDEIEVLFTLSSSVQNVLFGKVSVYPNPVTGEVLHISAPNFTGNFQVISLEGKLLQSGSIENTKTINVSQLSSGVYFVMLNDVNGNQAKFKFVK